MLGSMIQIGGWHAGEGWSVVVVCSQEESLRLRKLAMVKTTSSTPESSSFQSAIVEQPQPPSTFPSLLIVVIAVILGLVVGKLIL